MNRKIVYGEYHVTRHLFRHVSLLRKRIISQKWTDFFDEISRVEMDDLFTQSFQDNLKEMKREIQQFKAETEGEWTLQKPKLYLEDLSAELKKLKEDVGDLIFLIREQFNIPLEMVCDDEIILNKAKKYRFKQYTAKDFECVMKTEFRILQNDIPKIQSYEESYNQLQVLGEAIYDIRNAMMLYNYYIYNIYKE
ncbi:MAG: hypothetical protein Q4G05_03600 [Clostridia bacterium]|nr:hypothetical protein [Clostridia bacterium]